MLERERGGWCIIGGHCHRNAVWMTFQVSRKPTLKPLVLMPLGSLRIACSRLFYAVLIYPKEIV
jgi:hypothetical protein